jgi:hypothetical protein
MMQSLPADHVLAAVNAVALTIAENLRRGTSRWTGYCNVPPVSKGPLVELIRTPFARVPMKSDL